FTALHLVNPAFNLLRPRRIDLTSFRTIETCQKFLGQPCPLLWSHGHRGASYLVGGIAHTSLPGSSSVLLIHYTSRRRIKVEPVRSLLEDFMAAQHGVPQDLRITDLGGAQEAAR